MPPLSRGRSRFPLPGDRQPDEQRAAGRRLEVAPARRVDADRSHVAAVENILYTDGRRQAGSAAEPQGTADTSVHDAVSGGRHAVRVIRERPTDGDAVDRRMNAPRNPGDAGLSLMLGDA